MRDLSVIIPARNEMFLLKTIENVLENATADTEVIAILDGYWPDPAIPDHPNVTIIHHTEAIGQRAATNEGARVSQAKYIMKLDAHCAVDKGFDTELIKDCQPDWTMVPRMYNLHAFDWVCSSCGWRRYQGAEPEACGGCDSRELEMDIVWGLRRTLTFSWRFDKSLQFQYWNSHCRRPGLRRKKLLETMSFIGACMFLERERFWELDGMDEKHGSWGQFGTEWACKSWLSGGKLVTSKKTWFAHMFRTGNFNVPGKSPFPYPLSGNAQKRARQYSRDLWLNDKWPKANYPLTWLIEKFKPIPDWHEEAK